MRTDPLYNLKHLSIGYVWNRENHIRIFAKLNKVYQLGQV